MLAAWFYKEFYKTYLSFCPTRPQLTLSMDLVQLMGFWGNKIQDVLSKLTKGCSIQIQMPSILARKIIPICPNPSS